MGWGLRILRAMSIAAAFAMPGVAQAAGALAFAAPDGYAFAHDERSPEEARAAALRQCSRCSVVAYFQNICAAFATDRTGSPASHALGAARDEHQARGEAMATCQSKGGVGCTVRTSACESTVRREGKAWLAADVPAPPPLASAAKPKQRVLPPTPDVTEEIVYLRTKMKDQTVRLEALVVKGVEAGGRLPLAFVSSGRPGSTSDSLDDAFTALQPIARDLARRGWLSVIVNRRGYGRSDGSIQSDDLRCEKTTMLSYMYSDADELRAALEVLAKRSDVDATRIMSIGHSAGGGASMGFNARSVPGTVGIVNLSGGEHWDSCHVENSIPIDFRDLGSHSRAPSLWIFAHNDENHPPEQVDAMREAFTAAGGKLRFLQIEDAPGSGHTATITSPGRRKWLPVMDAWLRERNLPTWSLARVDTLMNQLGWGRMGESRRTFLKDYIDGPGEKALAGDSNNGASWSQRATLEEARTEALARCQQKGVPCTVLMENNRLVGETSARRGTAIR